MLFKAHGLGNDYLVWEGGGALTAAQVVAWCDRHRGPGGDGVLEPVPTDRALAGVRIWNPDGSQAEKSGNGLRIFAWWLTAFRGAPRAFAVETASGVVGCEVDGVDVAVEMGAAQVAPGVLSFVVDGAAVEGIAVDVGNPHCVVFRAETDLDALPWARWGAAIERDPRFPNRTNVQVARVADGACEARVWERGAGATLASGSSACAVAAAAVLRGKLPAGLVEVRMPGGVLQVTVREDHTVRLRGPVGPIGRLVLDPRFHP